MSLTKIYTSRLFKFDFLIPNETTKKKMEKEIQRRLDGNPDGLDPNLPIDYQTEFLPYDKRCEFPKDRLRLGLCSAFKNQFHKFHLTTKKT